MVPAVKVMAPKSIVCATALVKAWSAAAIRAWACPLGPVPPGGRRPGHRRWTPSRYAARPVTGARPAWCRACPCRWQPIPSRGPRCPGTPPSSSAASLVPPPKPSSASGKAPHDGLGAPAALNSIARPNRTAGGRRSERSPACDGTQNHAGQPNWLHVKARAQLAGMAAAMNTPAASDIWAILCGLLQRTQSLDRLLDCFEQEG